LLARIRRGQPETPGRHPLLAQLTPREYQVLGLIVEGKASKEIAVMLDLGVETVRSYRKTMMKKLHVNNVAGLIRVALAAGLAGKIQYGTPGS
jgi:DNA-binding CsgD family transcriptional regulator